MAKSRALEDTLAALHDVRDDPTSERASTALRAALRGKFSHAAAKAAQIAGEFEIGDLVPDLEAAFERFMTNPVKSDPTCAAKAAIAEALYRIGADTEALFLRGIRHIQLEPVYGGKADTATALRSVCALGLVRMNSRDALVELADLLADAESPVRAAAARAIAYSENDQGAPLLRLKVRTGDAAPEVVAECLAALLKVAPASSLAFVAQRLDADDEATAEAAALALGGSRLHEAFAVLRQWWERTPHSGLRRTALLAVAMLRQDQAIDFLLSVINEGNGPDARDAIAALAVYQHDESVCQRLRNAVASRRDLDLSSALAKAMGGSS